jgi:glucose/arabinose dehydrogenase
LLWASDVGQDAIEEVDIIQKGKNYGWNIMEGNSCYKPPENCDTTGLVAPIWQYPHSLGNAVVGGFVYRGKRVPELVGTYIYGDNGSGRIWSLRYDGTNPAVNDELIHSGLSISTFGVDPNNELYICAFDGKIYQFKTTVSG